MADEGEFTEEELSRLNNLSERQLRFLIWQRKWQLTARPTQLPPSGDWTAWGVLAGRGFGKTLTGAQWLSSSAMTCPNKFPHFVIAPTLNDVRHTCFEGPAGILSVVPPELILDYNKTNLIITLDTGGAGTTIRGFSAEEPERMRGPQCTKLWCFIAGTVVSTRNGDVPIEMLRPGDMVLTRKGERRVLANGRRHTPVGRVTFANGKELIGTANHPVYLKSGWTRLDQLQIGDEACAVSASSGAVERGTATMRATTSAPISRKNLRQDDFIEKCGSTLTGLSRKASTFITRTMTNETIVSKISNFFRRVSTLGTISLIVRQTDLTGVQNLGSTSSVSIAVFPFDAKLEAPSRNVRVAVTNVLKPSGSSTKFAWNVGQCSDLVVETSALSVASTWQPLGEQSVFCLKVDGEPEYFANGILVHNCDELAAWNRDEDTWDMAMMGLRLGKYPQVLWTTTPKPKDLVRKLVVPQQGRVIVRGSTYDNRANLPTSFFEQLKQYEGTQLGRQELDGELIDAEEGGIIQRKWFKLWPAKKLLPAFDWIVMSLDTAFTERTLDKRTHNADSTACTVWGVFWHENKRQVLLLDCWDAQLGMPELIKRVKKEMQAAYGDDEDKAVIKPLIGSSKLAVSGRKPDILLIEDKGSGISLRQSLDREGIQSYPYNPGRADKTSRLHMVSHIFARGQVWLPESEVHAGRHKTWADPMVVQLCSFRGPGSIAHDDYVDSCTQAIRLCSDKGLLEGTLMPKKGEEGYDRDQPPRRPRINPYAA